MTDELMRKFHAAQMRDVAEMQAIYEMSAQMDANAACVAAVGREGFQLSKETAEALEKRMSRPGQRPTHL